MQLIILILFFYQTPETIYKRADSLYFSQKYDSAIAYYKKAVNKFLLEQDTLNAAISYNDAGLCFYKLGIFDSAIFLYKKAFDLETKIKSQNVLIRLRNIAITYGEQGRFLESISFLKKAEKLAIEMNSKVNLAPINTLLGNLYLDQENYKKALAHFREALKLHQSLKNEKGIAIATTNLAINHYHLENLDSSTFYFNTSIQLKEALEDTSSLAYSFNGLGKVFFKKQVYDSAEYYFIKAYNIRKDLDQGLNIANTANELGRLYLTTQQPAKAKPYLDEAYQYATQQSNRTILMESLKLLGDYYQAISAYDRAYHYLERWSAMRDSVFNQEKLKVQELQSQYNLERSEEQRLQAENTALQVTTQKKQAYTIVLIVGSFLLIVIVFAVVFYRQRKQLTALSQNLADKNAQIAALNKQNFHFTKNSLAEMVSMLNVQLKSIEPGQVKDTLLAEKLRMETINLLYQQLFMSPEAGDVELSKLLSSIIENTMEVILGMESKAQLNLALAPIRISNEKALSIGMITNEICLNACKYALREGGTFSAELVQEGNEILLSLGDNGPGYTDKQNEKAFGLRLIEVLRKDLTANVSIDNTDKGLSYYFRIPLNQNEH